MISDMLVFFLRKDARSALRNVCKLKEPRIKGHFDGDVIFCTYPYYMRVLFDAGLYR